MKWPFRMPAIIGMFLFPLCVLAQQPASNIKLVPGSSDTIHDLSGIAIGMTCRDAIALASKISAAKGPGKFSITKSAEVLRTSNQKISYSTVTYDVPLNLYQNSISTDNVNFTCLAGGSNAVFKITRQMRFGAWNVGSAPPIASLRAIFQEKYGVPTVEFSPFLFATMYNNKGPVQSKDSCGPYQNGHLYLGMTPIVDPNKCSYALTFTAQTRRDNLNTVDSINIVIQDYQRLLNDVQSLDELKTQQTPVVIPKL